MAATSKKFIPRKNDIQTESIRSTVKFRGDFKEELQKTIDYIEEAIEGISGEYFVIDSITGGKNNLKARIDDMEQGVERIVNCEFYYRHSDERYGYINIDLVVTGYGIKSRSHTVGRFGVTDREAMKEKVLKDLVMCVKKS